MKAKSVWIWGTRGLIVMEATPAQIERYRHDTSVTLEYR